MAEQWQEHVRISTIQLNPGVRWASVKDTFDTHIARLEEELSTTPGQVEGFWYEDEANQRLVAVAVWSSAEPLALTDGIVRERLSSLAEDIGGVLESVQSFPLVRSHSDRLTRK